MWGKDGVNQTIPQGLRFNPTCVGKRLTGRHYLGRPTVQPHVCGEKAFTFGRVARDYGSTPRVWGKDRGRKWWVQGRRFNPTCVGKRWNRLRSDRNFAVQPHVCGEKTTPPVNARRRCGSTPRVWGKASNLARLGSGKRFNPTCVGKSSLHSKPRKGPRFNPTCVGKSQLRTID